MGLDISSRPSEEIGNYVAKAIAGIEVRSSAFLINKYTDEANRIIKENTSRAIELKELALNEYVDLLEQKRPELIPLLRQLDDDGICLAEKVIEPSHHSVRKELNKGRLLFYVKFDGGEACLSTQNFESLFGINF